MRKIPRFYLGVAIVCLTTASVIARPGSDQPDESRMSSHVRFKNDRIAEALQFAVEHSTRFREQLTMIDASNVIVHIEEGPCGQRRLRSCLQLMRTPGTRHLVIHVDSRQPRPSVVGQLAHELHHAVEIASEPDIVDAESLRRFYQRIGFLNCAPGAAECWETRAAQTVETLVLQQTINGAAASIVDDAYFGTWMLNIEKSTFENVPAPKDESRIYGDRGHGLISIIANTVAASGVSRRTAFVFRLDSKDYPMSADGLHPRRTIAVKAIDRFMAEFVMKQGGEIISTGRRTLDSSDMTMTIETQGMDAEGHPTRSVTIWQKQLGRVTTSQR